ncbi:YqhR family membrane protein [Virgibacillus ainsalahensis]
MNENSQQLEQNKKEHIGSLLSRSLLTGFIGGILWSVLGVIMYYFNFTEIGPKHYLLRSWNTAKWTDGWLGDIISILMVGLISIAAALIYYGIFKKVNSMWMGAAYGIILWLIIFFMLQPIFTNIPPLAELSFNTIISTICLFILYGTFIGYSISYDYNDTKVKASKEKEKNN